MSRWTKGKSFIIGMAMLMMVMAVTVGGCAPKKDGSSRPGPAGEQKQTPITVSAAISLKDALVELQEMYAQQNPGVKVSFNFGSSGALQKQIEEGAPVDVFISAGQYQVDELEQQGLLVTDSRKDLLGNELALVVAKGKETLIKGFPDLAGEAVGKISIGNPETVPAGKYAQEALNKLGLWAKLQGKLVPAKDVRQVLTYVDTGNVDAGLVYESDVRALKNGVKVATAPGDSHKPIVYPMALLKNSKVPAEARDFMNFLAGPEAAGVFTKHGFKPLLGK